MIKAVIFDYGLVIMGRSLHLRQEILDLAKELRDRNLKTAVLSNAVRPVAWLVKLRGDLKDFEPVVFSCDIGVSKPNPKSYEFVIKKLSLKPEECLFVDNRAENIAGAEALGMPVVLSRNTAQTVENIERILKTNS